jgi:hypothetical protein
LVHPEGGLATPSEGHWPSKKLRAIVDLIGTPYHLKMKVELDWHRHLLTPGGAWWAVDVASKIKKLISAAKTNLTDR